MRTLRSVLQSLSKLPSGFNADGRTLGLGLDSALRAQRAQGADVSSIRAPKPAPVEAPLSRAS